MNDQITTQMDTATVSLPVVTEAAADVSTKEASEKEGKFIQDAKNVGDESKPVTIH
jgi:hypothetical protein